eukprot:16113926-Heterocapsa_arctica.AAC.1
MVGVPRLPVDCKDVPKRLAGPAHDALVLREVANEPGCLVELGTLIILLDVPVRGSGRTDVQLAAE